MAMNDLFGESATPRAVTAGFTLPEIAAIDSPFATLSPDESISLLDVINQRVQSCTLCSNLATQRTHTVFGVGNPQARLCFVGEAPGANEDRQGEPFVGEAGQLLTRILAACGLRRSDVYICNILKCRPPQNRRPLPDEVRNCRPFLEMQLKVLRPQLICCLGNTAAHTLLGTSDSMATMRGRTYEYQGIPVICTYHPAFLLRTPSMKREVWLDMQRILRFLGLEVPRSAMPSRQDDERHQDDGTPGSEVLAP